MERDDLKREVIIKGARPDGSEFLDRMAAAAQWHPQPILQFTPEGVWLQGNRAAQTLALVHGVDGFQKLLFPGVPEGVKECWANHQAECRIEKLPNGQPFAWTFVPDAEAGVVHCFLADLSERQKLQEQLFHSQRLESIGRLAVGVAHDFNNLLTVIQGHTQLLLGGVSNTDATSLLKAIEEAAYRAGSVTRHLLVFSRKHVFQSEQLDLNQLVQSISKLLRRVLGEDIALQLKLCPELPALQGDACMLEQMILTLAINAREVMPGGGRLLIETETHRIEQVATLNGGNTPETCVSLRVTNSASRKKPPNTALPISCDSGKHAETSGPGFGVVQGIAKQHKGWITVETAPEGERAIQIYLPASVRPARPQNAEGAQEKVPCGTETVLLVEDEKPLRTLVRHILMRHGYKVLEAESGLAAVQVWEQHKSEIELLLTDIVMPEGINGQQLASRLKADRPVLKVLYTSGYNEEIVGKDFILEQGINFLRKPFHPGALLQAVRRCLDTLPASEGIGGDAI
jgi:two-component system, cell cycle sensor histidine kinase and response regulator CckA